MLHGPITFVQSIGAGTSAGATTRTVAFHPASATTAGHSVILVVGDDSPNWSGLNAVVTCSDTKNSTYTTDLNESSSNNQQVAVCAKHATLALATSDTIRVTISSNARQILVIGAEYSGLTGAVDASRSGTSPFDQPVTSQSIG